MAWTKFIVVVDHDVNVHDETAVLRAMFQHSHFGRDIELVNGPLDILDHAAPRLGAGCKMGIDATRKIPGEEVNGIPIASGPATPRNCNPRASDRVLAPDFGAGRCAFISVEKEAAGDGARAIQQLWDSVPPGEADFVVAVDSTVDLRDWQSVFFQMCANCDPGRDMHCCGERIAFDATPKLPGDERNGQPVRDYPPILTMTDEVKRSIDTQRPMLGLR